MSNVLSATIEIEKESNRRDDAKNARAHHYNLAAYRESPLAQAA